MTALDVIPAKGMPDVLKIMRTPNETEQVYAAVILGKIGKPAIGQLTPLLDDQDEVVRFYALWSLGMIGEPAKHLAPAVLKAMRDPDDDVRCKAAFALRRIGVPADQAVPALVIALKDRDDPARMSAADALVEYGKAAVPMLIPALKDREIFSRVYEILGRIGPDAKVALPAICESMDHWPTFSGAILDATATGTVGSLAKSGHVELAQVMKSKNPKARAHGVIGLINAGPEAAAVLLDALHDPEPRVRELAAAGLASIQTADASQVAALRKATFDANPVIRHFAVRALFRLDRDVEQFLRECWKRPKGKEQMIAAGASMEKLPKERAQWMAILAAKLEDADPDTRFEAALQLVRPWERVDDGTWRPLWARYAHEVVPVLAERMRDEKAINRHDAILALMSLHGAIIPEPSRADLHKAYAKLMPDFLKVLKSDDRRIRLAGLQALRNAVPIEKKYPPDLILLDGSGEIPDYDFRADVKTTLPAVAPLLKDSDRDVRLAALRAVLTFGPDAVPYLPSLIADPDWEVQSEALNGLYKRKHSAKKAISAMRDLARKHERSDHYEFFLRFLTEFDRVESFPYLVETLAKKNAMLRQALEDAGQKTITKKTTAALLEQLASPNRDVAVRAAHALAAISEFLSEDDKQPMRTAMIKMLQAKMPAIAKAMVSKDAPARREAASLVYDLRSAISGIRFERVLAYDDDLGKLDAKIEEILEGAFRDPDLEVRRIMRKFLRPARKWVPAAA
jgi:HEAT repeat protein